MEFSYRASMMDAATGASQVYDFKGEPGLFRKPANRIVRAFMEHMKASREWSQAPSYRLTSATKKTKNRVVMATGALLLRKGELPFLLMISPNPPAAPGRR